MPEKPPKTKSKKRPLPEGDKALWDQFSRDVTPLRGRKKVVAPSDISPTCSPAPSASPAEKRVHYTRLDTAHELKGAASPARPSAQIDKRTRAKFEKGDMTIEGSIDLHGMSEAKAHAAFSRFLARHIEDGSRCVLVVTGKGRGKDAGAALGVLNKNLPLWAMAPPFAPFILSVTHAQPKHGGMGAYYILLKRKRGKP